MRKKEESEDSIEEILSSIREIMGSEDTDPKKSQEDVLVLTDIVQDDDSVAPSKTVTRAERVALSSAGSAATAGDQKHKVSSSQREQIEENPAETFLSLIEKNSDNLQFEGAPASSDKNAEEPREETASRNVFHKAAVGHREKLRNDSSYDLDVEPSSKLSHKTQEDTLASLNRLRQKIADKKDNRPLRGSSGSLEDVVKEALYPLLEKWLEKHLPNIVEAVVTREVRVLTERLAGRE
jgi:cell pole-organizing protein PopZ